jgi:3-oxoacyl-[acyl-carrier-protein] synthase II
MTVYIEDMKMFTPFGNTKQSWDGILSNRVAYGGITKFDPSEYRRVRSLVAGEFHFKQEDYPIVSETDIERMPEILNWATALVSELIGDRELPRGRTAIVISPGISIYLDSLEAHRTNKESAYTFSPNMISNNINIKFGFTGPSFGSLAACSTGLHNVVVACMLLETGQADYAIAGSVDRVVQQDAYRQMGKLRALTTNFNDTPELSCRPWDVKRDGIVLSEGAGLMLLSKEKTSNTLAEIGGYGISNDAYQVVAPHPDGEAIEQCMSIALKGETPDLINAHATGTPMGDYVEVETIKRMGMGHIPLTANKSQLGHLMSASGIVEGIISVKSMLNSVITPTVNTSQLEDGWDLPITKKTIDANINSVLCNSFGFGGSNASIYFKKT